MSSWVCLAMMSTASSERLGNIAEGPIRTWTVGAHPTRVDVRSCLIDPLNGDQTSMSGQTVRSLSWSTV